MTDLENKAPAEAAPVKTEPSPSKDSGGKKGNKTLIIVIVVVVLLLGGCAAVALLGGSFLKREVEEEVSENITEEILEETVGGDAEVDIEDDSFTWESEEGSGSVGEATEWPDDIPGDIPEFTYASIISYFTLGDETGSGWTLTFEDAESGAVDSYESDLTSDGWEITSTFNTNDVEMISAEKDNYTVTCSCSSEDDTCSVIVSVEE